MNPIKYSLLSAIVTIEKGKKPKQYYVSRGASRIPYILIENFEGNYTNYVDRNIVNIIKTFLNNQYKKSNFMFYIIKNVMR